MAKIPNMDQVMKMAQNLAKQMEEQMDTIEVEGNAGDVQISGELGRLLNVTDRLAQKRKDQYISSELFVLAAVEDSGQLGDLLKKAGASKGALEKSIENVQEDKQWRVCSIW